jgi:serpin B
MTSLLFLFVAWIAGCASEAAGPQEISRLPRELSAGEAELIEASNAFGLKLFREIHGTSAPGANIFVSPLSVGMALAMTYNGAAGDTRAAMRDALELDALSLPEVNESYRSLIVLLRDLDPAVEFVIANSIWYDEAYTFREDFLRVNREYFDAEVTALDFRSPSAAPTINAWVAEKTGGRITEIVDDPIPVDPRLVMFLINAIYFKGDWTKAFDEELTAMAPFRLPDGREVPVPMMRYAAPDTVGYYRDLDRGVEVLDLAYGGRAFSLTIVLPASPGGLGALVASLDESVWRDWIAGLEPRPVIVVMPKFTLEYDVELRDVLTALGMGVAFEPYAADFSGIYGGPENLYISQVRHKTFVDVNEKGTEAAAVTSVEMALTSLPPEVRVDRPFLFAIRERLSGTILFLGVVRDPSP